MTPLTRAQIEKFKTLIEATGSRDQLTRIMARLKLNKFVIQHGEDACKAAFDSFKRRKK